MKYTRVCLLLFLIFSLFTQIVYASNLDPLANGSHYVWGENIGWIDLAPSVGTGVTITDSAVTGMAWGENTGWIDLSPAGGGVTNDGTGKLSGLAWSENAGWIDFNPAGGGVNINACGEFNGTAWGENVGWISFRSDGPNPFKVVSTWVSAVDTVSPVTSFFPPIQPWYTSNILFNFTATDCGSGVKEIHNKINNGTETVTPGTAAQVTVSQEGCNTLQYYAVDIASNPEAARQLSVCVDKTPPVITLTVPPDKVTYNINTPVTPVYTISDAISGVASSSVDTMTTNLAGSYTFTVAATDVAGNSAAVTHAYTVVYPGNIDPGATGCEYAWGENIGWIDFKPAWGPGITITDTTLTGMAWSENFGWIILDPDYGGVFNDGMGNLSGFAWNENTGWIDFNPAGGGVTIGTDGSFSGNAWGENIGWIVFGTTNTCLMSAWVNPYPSPASFSFANQNSVALSTAITSNTITVSGITTSLPIKINNGQYSINGGAFTVFPGTVKNGDTVAVRLTSSATYSMASSALLAIGGTSANFRVTTVNPPPPTISGTPPASVTIGIFYSFTPTATNASAFSATGILPPGLSFDNTTGTISGTPTSTETYSNIGISAINTSGVASLSLFTITVNPPQPTISGSLNTTAVVGTAYSFTLTATNATTFTQTGILPPGLTFDTNTGSLNGTPTTIGTYGNIIISAVNIGGFASLPSFSITVVASAAITWQKTIPCPGLNCPAVTSMAMDPGNPQIIYVGNGSSSGSAIKLTGGGSAWSWIKFPLNSPYRAVYTIATDPSNSQTIYAGTDIGMYKSGDGGATWNTINTGLPLPPFIPIIHTITVDQKSPLTLYAGTNRGVYKSSNGGANWQLFNNDPTYTNCASLALDPSDPQIVFAGLSTYLGNDGGVFKFTASTGVWTKVTGGLPFTIGQILALAIVPSTPQTIYAGTLGLYNTGGGIIKSIDGGNTWNVVASGTFIDGVYSLAIDPTNSNIVYAGVSSPANGGVLQTIDGGSTWRDISKGMINPTSIRGLAIDPTNPQTVYAGADSGGVYKTFNLPSPTISGTPATLVKVGNAYSFTPTAANASSFSITGAIPPGLTFSTSTGILSGTPTIAGVYGNLIITATNASGVAWLPAFTITVNPLPPSISGTPASTATVGSAYSFIPTATDAGGFSITGTVPPGLTFDKTTGILGGIPTTIGVYNKIQITVTNASGSAALPEFTITVALAYHTIETFIAGTGSGTVVSLTPGIPFSCPGNCKQGYLGGTAFNLTPQPSSTSYFSGWSGTCTNSSGDCQVLLDADKSVTATFTPLPVIRIMTGNTPSYVNPATLQNVYNNAQAGAIIQMMAGSFTDVLSANANKTVWIRGGFDSSFGTNGGQSIITGPLVISSGTVVVDSIGVK